MIFAGLRVSLALSFIVMFAAEMINARSGPRPHDPRRRELPALRPDVRVAPRIAILGYAGDRLLRFARARARLAGAAGMTLSRRSCERFVSRSPASSLRDRGKPRRAAAYGARCCSPSLASDRQRACMLFLRATRNRSWKRWFALQRALGGFALAAVVGVPARHADGPLGASSAALLDPLFSGTYAVPKLALFPIFIFVFGIGSLSKVALVFLECLYPIVIMTYHGARSVSRVLLWSAQNMGASRAAILRRVVIPATDAVHLRRLPRRGAGGDDRGGDHRDGQLGRRPRLSGDLLARRRSRPTACSRWWW